MRYLLSLLVALVLLPLGQVEAKGYDTVMIYWNFPSASTSTPDRVVSSYVNLTTKSQFQELATNSRGEIKGKLGTGSSNTSYLGSQDFSLPVNLGYSVRGAKFVSATWNPACGYGVDMSFVRKDDGYTYVYIANLYNRSTLYLDQGDGKLLSIKFSAGQQVKSAGNPLMRIYSEDRVVCSEFSWDWKALTSPPTTMIPMVQFER